MQVPLVEQNRLLRIVIVIMILGLLSGCIKDNPFPRPPKEESAQVLYDWYKLIAQIQLFNPPSPNVIQNTRDMGYIGVGVYEAVHPGIKKSVSLSTKLYQMPSMPEPEMHNEHLWGASANAAFASLVKQFYSNLTSANKNSIDSLENAYNNRFKLSTSDAVISRSQAFGRAIATAIYKWSTTEKFNVSSTGYVLPVFPGSWVLTPPAFANPVGPFLTDSRPFLQSSLTATAPPLPFPYSEDPSSEFYKAAKEVYDLGKALTSEQKAMIDFWIDAGGVGFGYPSPGHIIYIVTGELEKRGAKLGEAAELYAKTSIAYKESFYRIWKIKYQHNLIRPVTYIRKLIDKDWLSYTVTPPYPEYPSGLAGLYASPMQILTRAYGDVPVTDDIYAWRGLAPRHYASFTKLAEEVAVSRIYSGLHYRWTQDITLEIGKKLGDEIFDIKLIPSKHKAGD